MVKCTEKTLKGKDCGRKTKDPSGKCWQHRFGAKSTDPKMRKWRRQYHKYRKSLGQTYKDLPKEERKYLRDLTTTGWKLKASIARNARRLMRHGVSDPVGAAKSYLSSHGKKTSLSNIQKYLKQHRVSKMGSHKRSGYHRKSKSSRNGPKHIRFE